jgi:hypothetical protein
MLVIEGAGSPYSVIMSNHLGVTYTGLTLQAWIEQGEARRAAGGVAISCGAGPGVLEGKRVCEQETALFASNAFDGVGELRPGEALAVVYLVRRVHETEVQVLDRHVFRVELVEKGGTDHPSPVHMDATTAQGPLALRIEGPGLAFGVDMTNHTASVQEGVEIEGWIQQGEARRAAGGGMADCGGALGVFGPGACSETVTFFASNLAEGTGTLVPGEAFLVVRMYGRRAGERVLLDVHEIRIELMRGPGPDPEPVEFEIIEPSAFTIVWSRAWLDDPNDEAPERLYPQYVDITARACATIETFDPNVEHTDFLAYSPISKAWVWLGTGFPNVYDVGEKRCATWTVRWVPGDAFGFGPSQIVAKRLDWANAVVAGTPVFTRITIVDPNAPN